MAALSDFAKYVRPEVAGCPDIMILDAILQAGIEFCKRTKVAKQTFDVTTVVDEPLYSLTGLVDAGTVVDEILIVKRNEFDDLCKSSFGEFEDYRLDVLSGTPHYFYLNDEDEMVLGNIPNAVETLTVTVKTIPAEGATTLPDVLASRYRHQIASGAKSILMLMNNQAWTDVKMASIHGNLFEEAIGTFNLRHAKGNGSKPLRVTPHFF
jgi:hypothetical protein